MRVRVVSPSSAPTVGRTVDWGFAATVGTKLVRAAPPTTDYTRTQVIAQLTDFARLAEQPVREVTLLSGGDAATEACVVDRAEWVRAATDSMRVMTGGSRDGAVDGFLTSRITGAQTGAVLAFVSSGILGQYDPFADDGGHDGGDPGDRSRGGRLLLVHPNIVAVERRLQVSPRDFRLWVCLHEVTHRVQFRANPWLADHMSGALAVITDERGQNAGDLVARLGEAVGRRRAGPPEPDGHSGGVLGLVRALQTEPQREALDRLLVLGTLLEGHADHVMDAVGPAVVPTVATIRRRFDERRQRNQPPLQRILRALLGVDAKLAQYTRGKAFVDHVVAAVGMARFNAVWTNAETLPLPREVDEPGRWIDRVL